MNPLYANPVIDKAMGALEVEEWEDPVAHIAYIRQEI
jgi:hypothetical protein